MGRLRTAECRDAHARRERSAIARGRIEERALRIVTTDHGGPDEMDRAARVHHHCRPVVGAAVQLPAILTYANRRRERSPSVTRRGEGDVADVSCVDMTPRSVERAIRSNR